MPVVAGVTATCVPLAVNTFRRRGEQRQKTMHDLNLVAEIVFKLIQAYLRAIRPYAQDIGKIFDRDTLFRRQ